jgi:hypothetical protein
MVRLIEKDLEKDGHDVWRDFKNIRGGEVWSDAIEKAIGDAYVFIVVLSSTSSESEWVRRKIMFAQHHKKLLIIPVTLERVQLPEVLVKLQVIDFSETEETEGALRIDSYQEAIGRLLRDIEHKSPVLRNLKALKDPKDDIREGAARELGELGDLDAAEDALINALSDPDNDVRFEATRAIGELKSKAAYKHLVRLLREDDPDLCAASADALGKIGLSHATGPLLQLLDHPDRFVRQSSVRSLGKLGETAAVEPLIHLMRNDSISDVRKTAIEALTLIGGPVAERAISRKEAMEALCGSRHP